ncbi:MAG: DUF4142 domain-containing protein [Bacteroidetes bacterium]|nr:DUF4142 domain-containing protein [Bacteroidota bacterium]
MKKIILFSFALSAFAMSAQRDVKFATDAANGNLLEVKLGELAMQAGYSEAVKQLGQKMKEDHSQAIVDLMEITSKKGIVLATNLDEKGERIFEKLSKKNAEDFDKAYTKLMVRDHKKDLCEFKKQAKKGKDAELKKWAASVVPTLEHHLEMSKQACEQVKKK